MSAGTLHGLMRIKGFTQDDAHIFTTEEGLSDEISNLLTFVMSVLTAFGFNDFSLIFQLVIPRNLTLMRFGITPLRH